MRDLPDSLESKLEEVFSGSVLSSRFKEIREKARLTYLLAASKPKDGELDLGTSRLGGAPDMTPGLEWPRHPEDGLLLDFIGQINLSQFEISSPLLPDSGLMLIFAQQEEGSENPNKVIYIENPVDLKRHRIPELDEFSDETEEVFDIVSIDDAIASISLPDSIGFELNDAEFSFYDQAVLNFYSIPGQKEPASRLLGHPSSFIELSPDPDWECLIQVESFFQDGTCINFWDAGALHLTAKTADLSRRDYTKLEADISSC